ncbi:MAG: pilus assembly protein MshD [Candidatus Parabeggiatoa sp. nov. 3]|nr:MAG: pilus assembly protein MshD [Gammaproteobacteria bacterium]RKZ67371.1 MAG: pilus assembly protein MshD [Gammaproteobacteria bacterium]RKZ88206.1 MAG: pilus assembly protein MshD [Gammaproteobacteria bacterium]
MKILSGFVQQPLNYQQGISLLELTITLIVLGVGMVGVLPLMIQTATHSLDPILQQQANAIAQSYLEEILYQHFSDPNQTETGLAEFGERRATFDDVQDYNSLPDSVVRDYSGTRISALDGYVVTVSVNNDVLGTNAVPALRVDVRVTHRRHPDISVLLSGYRCGK